MARRFDALSVSMFKVRVEGRAGGCMFHQAFWTMQPTLDGAIARVLDAARLCGIDEPVARAADPLEPSSRPDAETVPTPYADTCCAERSYFPMQARFVPPHGIIESCGCTDLGTAQLAAGFVRTHENFWSIEVVPGREHFEPLLIGLVDVLASVDQLVVDHTFGCGGPDHWWTTEDAWRSREALQFVFEHRRTLLDSGYVGLELSDIHHGTKLSVDEHKVLRLETEDPRLPARVLRELARQGLRERVELSSLADFPHHHFQPPEAMDVDTLGRTLEGAGFERGR